MADIYSGNAANNPTSITLPEDGQENVDVGSIRPALEGTFDKTRHILEATMSFFGNKTFEGTVTCEDDLNIAQDINFTAPKIYTRGVGGYGTNIGSGAITWPTTATLPFGDTWQWPLLEVPNGATIRKLGIRINPADDALPTTNVRLLIVAAPVGAAGGASTLASVTDPLTGASYQAAHNFVADVSGSAITLNLASYTYWLRVAGESGGDEDNVAIEGAPWIEYSLDAADLGR